MRDDFLKWLPIASGLLIGFLIVNPPEFLGPWRWPIAFGIGLLLFAAVIALSIVKNMPEQVEFEEIPGGTAPPEFAAWIGEAERLGYEIADGPFRVMIGPPAVMTALRHRELPVWLALFKTGTAPPRAAFDFITTFERTRAGLTTSNQKMAGALPAAPGALRQVLPDGSLGALHAEHVKALQWLGLKGDPVDTQRVRDLLRTSLARQRRSFLGKPLRNTLTLIKRSVTGAHPHLGRLSEQLAEKAQIAQLRAGRFPDWHTVERR